MTAGTWLSALRFPLPALLGLALLVRLALFVAADRPADLFHLPDSAEYDRLAWNLADHGTYSLAEAPPWIADLTRTPVYPLFVALCYRAAGHQPAVAVAVQLVLAVCTCAAVYALGRRWFGPVTGTLAAGLLALDPLSARFAVLLLSETLFTLLLTGSLLCLLVYLRAPRAGWAAVAAVLAGLAILCRPIAFLWPAGLLLWFAAVAWRTRSWRSLAHALLALAVVVPMVGAWVLRNKYVGGVAVPSTVQGINLYYHRAGLVVAEQEQLTILEARVLLADRLRQTVEREGLSFPEEYALMEHWGLQIIRSAPEIYWPAHARGAARLFLPQDRPVPWPGLTAAATTGLEAGFLVLLYPLALVGLVRGLRPSAWLGLLLFGGTVVYFAAISGPEAYARFRVPVMPLLALAAGAGLAWPWRRFEDGGPAGD